MADEMMLQFHHPGGKPTLEQALALFGLANDDVDEQYGVATTDPRGGLYVILVRRHAADRAQAALARRPRHPAEGLFGNPRVEPMGPPEP